VACDLERDQPPLLAGWDVALSFEVANLIAPGAADRCIDVLCSVRRAVAFSAGPPGQGGDRVQNERPYAYWIEAFARRGFAHDAELSASWRARWTEAGTAPWFACNVLVFRRGDRVDRAR
jgi:hypothetical protein